MRPPTVRRSSGAPSRGQCTPGPRADVRSPVCEPPRRPRMRSVSRIARCKRLTLVVVERRRRHGPDRCRPARGPRRRAGCRARRCGDWSMSTALTGAGCGAERVRRAARSVSVERVGTEAVLVGIELDRAEPARIAQHEVAAVGEVHAEAVPLRDRAGCSRRRSGSPAASSSTSTRPLIPRCTPSADIGIASVSSRICLPRRRAAANRLPTSACRSAAAVVPRFRNHASGACTLTISRSSARASSTSRAASTSRISGTGRERDQKFVIAPVSAPCASSAYLARKPLV